MKNLKISPKEIQENHKKAIKTAKNTNVRLKPKILTAKKVQKRLVEALNRYKKQEKVRKSRFFFKE